MKDNLFSFIISDKMIYYFICIYALLSCAEDLGAKHFLRIAFCLGVVNLLVNGFPKFIVKTKHFYFIAAFLITLGIATLFNGITQNYYEGIKILRVNYLLSMLPMVLIIFFARQEAQIKTIILCVMISFGITNIYASWQFFHGMSRVFGLTGGTMQLAGLLILLIPLSLLILLSKDFISKYRIVLFISLLLAIPVVFFNATRIVWIALLIIIPIMLMCVQENIKKVFIYSIIVFTLFIGFCITLHSTQERFLSLFDRSYQSNSERVLMWNSAWNMFIDHPIVGVGLENYEEQYQNKYISPEAKERLQVHAHNNFLHIAASTGIIGLISSISMFCYFSYESFKTWSTKKTIPSLIFFITTLGFCIQGFTDYNLGNIAVVAKVYWMILAIYMVLDKAIIVEERVKK